MSKADDRYQAWLAQEWRGFILGVRLAVGSEWWTAREIVGRELDFPMCVEYSKRNPAMSLGRWLAHRQGKDLDGLVIEGRGGGNAAIQWRVVTLKEASGVS